MGLSPISETDVSKNHFYLQLTSWESEWCPHYQLSSSKIQQNKSCNVSPHTIWTVGNDSCCSGRTSGSTSGCQVVRPPAAAKHTHAAYVHTSRFKRPWGIVKLTGDIWPSDWEYKKSDIMEPAVKAQNGTEQVPQQEGLWVKKLRPGWFGVSCGLRWPSDDIRSWQNVWHIETLLLAAAWWHNWIV